MQKYELSFRLKIHLPKEKRWNFITVQKNINLPNSIQGSLPFFLNMNFIKFSIGNPNSVQNADCGSWPWKWWTIEPTACCWIDRNNDLDWGTFPITAKLRNSSYFCFFIFFAQIVHLYKLHSCTTIISSQYFTCGSPVKQSNCRGSPIRQICTLDALLQLTGNVWD